MSHSLMAYFGIFRRKKEKNTFFKANTETLKSPRLWLNLTFLALYSNEFQSCSSETVAFKTPCFATSLLKNYKTLPPPQRGFK